MTPEWERYAAGQTYLDVEGMLRKFARQTAQRFNLDFEAAMSAANEGFVRAFRSYRPELGWDFTTWCGEKAKRYLQNFTARELGRQSEPLVSMENTEQVVQKELPKFDLESFLATLSPDSAFVAKLVFETPTDVLVGMAQIGKDDPEAFRSAVREFLVESGWSKRKIRRTFMEIRSRL